MAFEAQWAGVCGECEEWFQSGDYIDRHDRGGYRHAGVCPESVEQKRGEICGSCFIEKSLTGACGCED